MGKIKVSFISFLAYPLFNGKINAVFGGAEVDLYNLARKLSESGRYDITFYVGDYGQEPVERYEGIKVRKVRYMNLDTYKSGFSKVLRQLSIIREMAAMDSHVCMVEAYNEMLGWAALLPGKLRNTRLIFRLAHDLDTDFADAKGKGPLYYNLYKYGINKAHVLISQTDRQKKMLAENLGLDSRVIKNGFFINDKISLSDKKYILWIARAQDWKRPDIFLQLAERLPEESFVMVMPGENELQARIKQRAGALANLRFVDYVPFAEVQSYYDRAKLFVNTSEYEGFPNAFVQACLGKTPILSFNVNPDGFIETNGLGFHCEDDLEKAVAFIRGFDGAELARLGENAGGYVAANHDIGSISKVYEEIIGNLTTSTGHGD